MAISDFIRLRKLGFDKYFYKYKYSQKHESVCGFSVLKGRFIIHILTIIVYDNGKYLFISIKF